MAFQLPPLPWSSDALEPYISAKTMSFHYGKHHMAYVNKLNAAIENTPLAEMSLEQIFLQLTGANGEGSDEGGGS